MFNTLLIANRGEIACRIARTARRMGLRTVAVYSDADRDAKHVAACDTAVHIGPAEAARSYLNAVSLVAAARNAGAQAIHPGYGFLSESLELTDACAAAGLIFVGPKREAIRCMGSKIESKRIAQKHGVPVVPGYYGDRQDKDALAEAAEGIGFPLLIKASAGGGGKGMRVVTDASKFTAALDIVRHEAKASFGDECVLLERYLPEPRHLEVQLLGDRKGHLVHLFERECSIQRNHQKIIEEAPAAHLSSDQREALYQHALSIGHAISYDSLGTVEFIHDTLSGETFFLEMNTRLQVEHPVTEAIVGLDLVEWQLRVAGGEALAFRQEDLRSFGWAIEARVCAENPAADFAPEVGVITGYREPAGDGVRVDSGFGLGSLITPYYDSMLAKVIASADTRELASRRLVLALDNYEVLGVRNNLGFLADLLRQPAFADGLTTRYIERAFPSGWQSGGDADTALIVAALGCVLAAHNSVGTSPWHILSGWRLLGDAAPCSTLVLLEDGDHALHEIQVQHVRTCWRVTGAHGTFEAHAVLNGERLEIERDGVWSSYRFICTQGNESVDVWLSGMLGTHVWRRVDRWRYALSGGATVKTGDVVRAPMPGLVTAVPAKLEAAVRAGEPLILMEAMKMLHTLVSPCDGYVAELRCRDGDAVRSGDILVVLRQGADQ